jgi:mannose-6-phosphate isomerase class I
MDDKNIPFQTIDWKNIPRTEHAGTTGMAYWQTMQFDGLRVRCVEYSENYLADHWCEKGHIVYCLEGEVTNELKGGSQSLLTEGMSYIVSDELSTHRSTAKKGCTLLIIDGAFLQLQK